MTSREHDFIAIGLGPFNLGLACLTAPLDDLDGLFLEKDERFDWHPGMLLERSTLQTPFLGDLVTLADPTSPFSFLNYIKSKGRIYSFYVREDFFLTRVEYNQYCRWAVERLPNIEFNRRVERVEYDEDARLYTVHCLCTKTRRPIEHKAKRLVLGTGTSPDIPECCRDVGGPITHTSAYLDDKKALQAKRSITLVGSGQSAAEVYYDLLQDIDDHGYTLNWITRSPRFYPLELTKLTLEMTSPDYTEYFYHLPSHKRDKLVAGQKNLYKGINASLINDIYDLLYTKSLSGPLRTNLLTNTEMRDCVFDGRSGGFELDLYQHEQEARFGHRTDALILATGYRYRVPDFLDPIVGRIRWNEGGRFAVERNYSIDEAGREIFVQNAELHTHGFVAPDLGMACHRNARIIREMLGREPYPVERGVTFQRFAAPSAKARRPEFARA